VLADTGEASAAVHSPPGVRTPWFMKRFSMRLRICLLAAAAGAALLGSAGCQGQDPVAGAATSPSQVTDNKATATAAPASAAPASTGPASTGPESRSGAQAGTNGCPVSASTLDKSAGYPAGWRIDAASVRCSQGWAVAGVIAPTPDQQGNGVIVFRYDTGTGKWKKKGEGSDIECAAFDMPPSTGLCSKD
jgi:hypothetical protein